MSSESVPVSPEESPSPAVAPASDNTQSDVTSNAGVDTSPSAERRPSAANKIWAFVLLRLLFFVVPLGVMLVLQFDPWYAAITSALIGFALSLLLLQRQRDPLLEMVYQRSNNSSQSKAIRGQDEDFEDAAVDGILEDVNDDDIPSTKDAN
ncbi:MAG: DUF4229 domain-containing protein [Microbacteriaceae bacterium]